jgi:uncharacterized protein YbbC (DUF1343 family)
MIKFTLKLITLIFLFEFNLQANPDAKIDLGIDVLVKHKFSEIKGKRVALLTNFSGRDKNGNLTAEILATAKETKLTLILTPEHGLYGTKSAGEKVENTEYWNVPVISLYGQVKKIPVDLANQFDVIVVDIQDIGVRAYTYISTLYYVMQSAAELGKELIVLDRPNPIGGIIVDGNVLDNDFKSFIGIIPVPYIHGMTIGEIALMINKENWLSDNQDKKIECNIKIVKMEGWKRWMQWEDTGLIWFPTSPNIPSVDAVRGAAMIGWIGELSLFSVGIGTNLPFQYFGTPQFDNSFFETFNNFEFNGVKLIQAEFIPQFGKFSNELCKGFLLRFERTNNFTPFSNGIEFLLNLRELYPKIFDSTSINHSKKQMFEKATGTDKIFSLLFSNGSKKEIIKAANEGIIQFIKFREKYLLY